MQTKLYSTIANLISARANCIARQMQSMADEHADKITELCKQYMPSGSGFDNGTTLDMDASTGDKLVFNTAFHHMDEHGGYDGWTEHRVYVTPSLIHGIELRITGRDRNQIKDYICEAFGSTLQSDVKL